MNTHRIGGFAPAAIVVSALLALSACSSNSATTPASGGNTQAGAVSTTAGNTGSGSSGSAPPACSLLTTSQVAALTGGTPAATAHSSSVLETSDCTYKTASLNEVDLSVSPISLSPSCAADAGAVLVSGVGKCAVYDSQLSLLTVYGSTYSCTISASGFAATEAQLEQLGTAMASKL
jgi:hypothetical protein